MGCAYQSGDSEMELVPLRHNLNLYLLLLIYFLFF